MSLEETNAAERIVLRPEERRQAVIGVIQAARTRLELSIFRCTDRHVIAAIAEAVQRGVQVRLLLTPKAKGWKQRLRELHETLENAGAQVRRYCGPVKKYHAKYIVADGELALVASLNYTKKCFRRTCDFVVITRDAEVIAGLTMLFETDWQNPPAPLPAGITSRLIIGPENARDRFMGLFAGARRSIEIVDHKVEDECILALLESKRADGVNVQVLGQGAVADLVSHGKLFLVDGQTAVIGSASLCERSLDHRREISIVVHDAQAVATLKQFFLECARTGSNGHDPSPTPAQ